MFSLHLMDSKSSEELSNGILSVFQRRKQSFLNSLQNILSSNARDNYIKIMFESPESVLFIPDRICELIEKYLTDDREKYIQDLYQRIRALEACFGKEKEAEIEQIGLLILNQMDINPNIPPENNEIIQKFKKRLIRLQSDPSFINVPKTQFYSLKNEIRQLSTDNDILKQTITRMQAFTLKTNAKTKDLLHDSLKIVAKNLKSNSKDIQSQVKTQTSQIKTKYQQLIAEYKNKEEDYEIQIKKLSSENKTYELKLTEQKAEIEKLHALLNHLENISEDAMNKEKILENSDKNLEFLQQEIEEKDKRIEILVKTVKDYERTKNVQNNSKEIISKLKGVCKQLKVENDALNYKLSMSNAEIELKQHQIERLSMLEKEGNSAIQKMIELEKENKEHRLNINSLTWTTDELTETNKMLKSENDELRDRLSQSELNLKDLEILDSLKSELTETKVLLEKSQREQNEANSVYEDLLTQSSCLEKKVSEMQLQLTEARKDNEIKDMKISVLMTENENLKTNSSQSMISFQELQEEYTIVKEKADKFEELTERVKDLETKLEDEKIENKNLTERFAEAKSESLSSVLKFNQSQAERDEIEKKTKELQNKVLTLQNELLERTKEVSEAKSEITNHKSIINDYESKMSESINSSQLEKLSLVKDYESKISSLVSQKDKLEVEIKLLNIKFDQEKDKYENEKKTILAESQKSKDDFALEIKRKVNELEIEKVSHVKEIEKIKSVESIEKQRILDDCQHQIDKMRREKETTEKKLSILNEHVNELENLMKHGNLRKILENSPMTDKQQNELIESLSPILVMEGNQNASYSDLIHLLIDTVKEYSEIHKLLGERYKTISSLKAYLVESKQNSDIISCMFPEVKDQKSLYFALSQMKVVFDTLKRIYPNISAHEIPGKVSANISILSSICKQVGCEDPVDLSFHISKYFEDMRANQQHFSTLLSSICKLCGCDDPSSIPHVVVNLISDIKQKESINNSLLSFIGANTSEEFQHIIESQMQTQKTLNDRITKLQVILGDDIESSAEYLMAVKSEVDKLGSSGDTISRLRSFVSRYNGLVSTQEIITSQVSSIYGNDVINGVSKMIDDIYYFTSTLEKALSITSRGLTKINIPIDERTKHVVAQSIQNINDDISGLNNQIKSFLGEAASQGFVGSKIIDAMNFIVDKKLREQKVTINRSHESEMNSLREVYDRAASDSKREIDRLKQAIEKLRSEQENERNKFMSREKELIADCETSKSSARSASTELSTTKRVVQELLRSLEGKVADLSFLGAHLSASEFLSVQQSRSN